MASFANIFSHSVGCPFVLLTVSFNVQRLSNFSKLFIDFVLVALGLYCCVWAFSSCYEQGVLFVTYRLHTAVDYSFVVKHRL